MTLAIQSQNETITAWDIIPRLARYQMLPQLIKESIIDDAIATASITSSIQPAQAQYNIAGRWQCQNSVRGLTKTTRIVAANISMVIDANSDGTFQAQQIEQTPYGTFQVIGSGQWQLQNNSITFAGRGQSSNPSSYGSPVIMMAMGNFYDANTFMANMNDGHFANSYSCQKIQ